MKCYDCGGTTTVRSGEIYHYTESGLSNVYLENVEMIVCESCGVSTPRLRRVETLHAAIGRAIALQPVALSGEEVRFLRKQLGLKAREWAVLLRVDTATLSRWENDEQQIGPQSDSLIRLLYFRILEEKEGAFIVDRIAERIASVAHERNGEPAIVLNMDNPVVYTYYPTGFALQTH